MIAVRAFPPVLEQGVVEYDRLVEPPGPLVGPILVQLLLDEAFRPDHLPPCKIEEPRAYTSPLPPRRVRSNPLRVVPSGTIYGFGLRRRGVRPFVLGRTFCARVRMASSTSPDRKGESTYLVSLPPSKRNLPFGSPWAPDAAATSLPGRREDAGGHSDRIIGYFGGPVLGEHPPMCN